MKKLLTSLVVLASVGLFIGCSGNKPATTVVSKPLHLTLKKDTTIQEKVLDTARRFSCEGKTLKHPKLMGVGYINKVIHMRLDTTISDSSLREVVPVPVAIPISNVDTAKNIHTPTQVAAESSSWSIPDWFKDLLLVLLLLLIAAGVIYLICAMWRHFVSNKDESSAFTAPIGTPGAQGNTTSRSSTSGTFSSQEGGDTFLDKFIDIEILAQLQCTGGKFNRYADGAVSMEVPNQNNDDVYVVIIEVPVEKEKTDKKKETKK